MIVLDISGSMRKKSECTRSAQAPSLSGRAELGFLLVDYQSDPRRIVRRATQIVQRFLDRGWFDQYIAVAAMTLTVLTTSTGRVADLEQKITSHWRSVLPMRADPGAESERFPIRLSLAVVPDLADLLTFRTPQPTAGAAQ